MGWGKLTRCCGAFENTNVLFLHLRLEQLDFVVGILVRLDVGFAQHAEVFGFALYKYLGLAFQARVRIDCRSVCNGMRKLAYASLVGTVRLLFNVSVTDLGTDFVYWLFDLDLCSSSCGIRTSGCLRIYKE